MNCLLKGFSFFVWYCVQFTRYVAILLNWGLLNPNSSFARIFKLFNATKNELAGPFIKNRFNHLFPYPHSIEVLGGGDYLHHVSVLVSLLVKSFFLIETLGIFMTKAVSSGKFILKRLC